MSEKNLVPSQKVYFYAMVFQFLFEGILIGFLASLPVGPISILIIQQTVKRSRLAGFCSGIGAAFSDTIYATMAGFSLSFIIEFIRANELAFKTGGSVILAVLGIFIFLGHPEREVKKINGKSNRPLKSAATTFLLTFTNPLIIFLHVGIFTGSGIVLDISRPNQAILILTGFFLGAIFWWFLLTGIVSLFRKQINTKVYHWFNKTAGATIVIIVLVSLIISLFHRI
jgi:threonine/homoserine/homoserine lactone efflux protein